jgi:ABC-type multidrug transport system fused ATPase/permease subunit
LAKALIKSFKSSVIICVSLQFISSALDIVNPILVKSVIIFVSAPNPDVGEGFLWLFILIGVKVVSVMTQIHQTFLMVKKKNKK